MDKLIYPDGIQQTEIVYRVLQKYSEKYHKVPIELSTWNSGKDYKAKMMGILKFDKIHDYFDYIYSYTAEPNIIEGILNKNPQFNNCVLFNSATAAILTICQALKAKGIDEICVLKPCYFSVLECLKTLGLKVDILDYDYDGLFHIPFKRINDIKPQALWITQPVFSTGTSLPSEELKALSNCDYEIICDSAMCISETALFADTHNITVIYSPHKILSLNGIKFSYVLGSDAICNLLEDWSESLVGGLTTSSIVAAKHYLSDNYNFCCQANKEFIDYNRKKITELLARYTGIIYRCGRSEGVYETLYTQAVPFQEKYSYEYLFSLVETTGVCIIPECNDGFKMLNGLSFRINYTLDTNKLIYGLHRLINYWEHQH